MENAHAQTGLGLAFDVGGTKIIAALDDQNGVVIALKRCATEKSGPAVIAQVLDLSLCLLEDVDRPVSDLRTIVLGLPGVPNPESGQVGMVTNIDGWEGLDVRAAILERFNSIDLCMENDVKLAALGEFHFAKEVFGSNFGFLNVGTGISLGSVIDGAILHGPGGVAGEIGLMPIVPVIGADGVLSYQQLEVAMGSYGLIKRYNERIEMDRQLSNVREIFDRAENGDGQAKTVLDDFSKALAIALLSIHGCLGLRSFVFGGSIGMNDQLIKAVGEQIGFLSDLRFELHKSRLDNKAGIYGGVSEAVRRIRAKNIDSGVKSDSLCGSAHGIVIDPSQLG